MLYETDLGVVFIEGDKVISDGEQIDTLNTDKKVTQLWNEYCGGEGAAYELSLLNNEFGKWVSKKQPKEVIETLKEGFNARGTRTGRLSSKSNITVPCSLDQDQRFANYGA